MHRFSKKKFDFQPNLSIIDLFFNEGPESVRIIEDCFKE
ncbi:WbqC family protein [Prolixibacter bellariivorans]